MFKPGHPVVYYGPEGVDSGGNPPANNPPPAANNPPPDANNPPPPAPGATNIPWGSDPNAKWMIGDKPWYETVYPDGPTKELMRQKDYANPVVVGDSYFQINKMVSSEDKRILVPGQDAKPEEWDAFYNKLGRPEKPAEYDFEKSIQPPEGGELDETLVNRGKEVAHKLGLNKVQATQMAEAFQQIDQERQAQATEQFNKINAEELTALETKYGADLNANKAAGQRVAAALGMDEAFMQRIEANIGAAPVVDLLVRLGRASDEGTFRTGGGGDPDNPDNMTPEAAAAAITRLQGDAEFQKKFTDKNHAENRAAIQRMEKLFARAGDKAPV